MVIWIRNGIMVIENLCGDRYSWDPGVLVQFSTAIKPMVISISSPEMAERIREHKTKFDSVRRKLATTSKPTVNTKKHKHTDGLGFLKIENQKKKSQLCRIRCFSLSILSRENYLGDEGIFGELLRCCLDSCFRKIWLTIGNQIWKLCFY